MQEKTGEISEAPGVERRRRNLFVGLAIRLFKEKPLGAVGAIIVLILFIAGIGADLFAPYHYTEISLVDRLQGSSAEHIFGTDELGRDLFSRILYGARVSMLVGLCSAILGTLISTIIGLLSGYLGGRFDLIVQRFVDAWMSFPGIFLILSSMALVGTGLIQVIVVIGVLYGVGGSRIVRGAVVGIKENQYVQAAVATGNTTSGLLVRHILPNIMPPLIVLFTTRMASMILLEATMSFLGYGIPPPMPSWGGMLSGSGRRYMLMQPEMVIWPGLALALTVYGINMLGDAIRDLLDPSLRGGGGRYTTSRNKKRRRVQS